MYLVTAAEMQAMDQTTIESFGLPGRVLMENAGRGAVRFLARQIPDVHRKRVAVVAGRGNNGGDGFVMARYLAQAGTDVTVYLLAVQNRVQGDAAANLKLLRPLNIPVVELPDGEAFEKHRPALRHHDLWIDAILGTGLKSDVKGYFKTVIDFINHRSLSRKQPIFSVDIPSGLDSDTGQPHGTCIRALATATFAYPKIGHQTYPGLTYTGNLDVVDIGIPPFIADRIAPRQWLATEQRIADILHKRPPDSHKGRNGHLLVIAGSTGKTGAAAMTAASAMRAGTGLVTLGVAEGLHAVLENQVVEVMTHPLPQTAAGVLGEPALDDILALLTGKNVLALGPGLGTDPQTVQLVKSILIRCPVPLVIDADGLNCLADNPELFTKAKAPPILTPHPGEMARLSGDTTAAIQSDRITHARRFARRYGTHLVLKGARTVVAHPDGRVWVNPTGNAGMASGGMGDVLTGVIAALVAQGYKPEDAAVAGVYLHGAAADIIAEICGPIGYLATEVMKAIPQALAPFIAAP